ncbi:MAG: tetratricopeptide repeat protein [Alphaproteobacteria bacterium]
MGGWRTAEILVRLALTAVIFAAVLHYGLPRLPAPKPPSEPSTEEPASAASALRREPAIKLLPEVWCKPDRDVADDRIDALRAASDKERSAAYALGIAYLRGWGVRCNPAKGRDLLERSAASGFAPAHYALGILAENGQGEPRSLGGAAEHYRLAGEAGHVRAMQRFAGALAEGLGVEGDMDEAVDWFTRAAEKGDALSAYNLAVMNEAGEAYGLEPSLAEAYYWFSIAAQLGDQGALDHKRSVARELDSEELDDANHRANAWRAEPKDAQANADFESIIEDFAEPTEATAPSEPSEPTNSAPEPPAS